jgi:hypothetical protein
VTPLAGAATWHHERRRVELGDRAGAAAAAAHVIPEAFAPHAERRDDADAADNDAWLVRVTHVFYNTGFRVLR